MNFDEFHKQLADTPLSFRRKLRDYLRRPTERNACYIAGYVAALGDARLFKTEDAANYWLAVIGRTERMPDVGEKLIAEMDSPPAGGTQAAALEAVREERDAMREALKDADNELDWLDEDMDTCDHSVGVCVRDYWNMRRKMKAALAKEKDNEQ